MSTQAATFTVGELVATTLQALLGAASAHLGEPGPDGRVLEAPDPLEAWLALKGASALLDQLAPVMRPEMQMPYRAALMRLMALLEARTADMPAPRRSRPRPVASLRDVVADALGGPHEPDAPAPPAAPSSRSGPGLPRRRSPGLLGPAERP